VCLRVLNNLQSIFGEAAGGAGGGGGGGGGEVFTLVGRCKLNR